jgi:hypothetical protein
MNEIASFHAYKFSHFPNAGHENYLIKYKPEWSMDIENFLQRF